MPNGLSGTFTVSAAVGTTTRITGSPLPVNGTVTLDFTSASFSGTGVTLYKRALLPAAGSGTPTWKQCAYRTAAAPGTYATTALNADAQVYVDLDGEELGYQAGYTSGSLTCEWRWSAG